MPTATAAGSWGGAVRANPPTEAGEAEYAQVRNEGDIIKMLNLSISYGLFMRIDTIPTS